MSTPVTAPFLLFRFDDASCIGVASKRVAECTEMHIEVQP